MITTERYDWFRREDEPVQREDPWTCFSQPEGFSGPLGGFGGV